MAEDNNRDLVLPPNTYAYVLDTTKGNVNVIVGPNTRTLTASDQMVRWDADRSRFVPIDRIDQAILTNQAAREGQYIILTNPSDSPPPDRAKTAEAVPLQDGRKVNTPGPVSFPLWPGQSAQTLEGHHLRHNQYLMVRVYDAEQAQANWRSAVVAPAGDGVADDVRPSQTRSFTTGQLMVVKGTDVSFYIPPTGIEVVPEAATNTGSSIGTSSFVRDAVTLERLEYCILLDENGNKRYVSGPAVVFPEPTEQFVVDRMTDGTVKRKLRAIELNEHSGVYVKVIAEYTDEQGRDHPIGEELFITGKEQAIYFPRAEHGIIRYGDAKQVHYAIAIPEGEGRYVLNRDTGDIKLVRGPSMYLPDPRHEVVVLRILDPHACELFYPGNEEAVQVNMERAGEALDFDDSQRERRLRTTARNFTANVAAALPDDLSSGYTVLGASEAAATSPAVAAVGGSGVLRRGTSYSKPRSIVLDTKYEGAVTINIWPGYAVLVVNKADKRRVEVGPKMVLLEYDETILPLELSTGRPKSDSRLLRTAYLRIINNAVSDRVVVETRDLVQVTLDISYRVDFEGATPEEQQKWFALENYVKVLTDHCRSRLRGEAKRHGILEFYTGTIDIIRDALLGKVNEGRKADGRSRPGMAFEANGMRLFDVEVLDVQIQDESIDELLGDAQKSALTGAIELQTAEDASERNARIQELRRRDLDEVDKTTQRQSELALANIARGLDERLRQLNLDLQTATERTKITDLELTSAEHSASIHLAIDKSRQEVEIERLVAETAEYINRMKAMDGNLTTALANFGDRQFVESLVTALGPIAATLGVTTADVFARMFKGTPFEKVTDVLSGRPLAELHS